MFRFSPSDMVFQDRFRSADDDLLGYSAHEVPRLPHEICANGLTQVPESVAKPFEARVPMIAPSFAKHTSARTRAPATNSSSE